MLRPTLVLALSALILGTGCKSKEAKCLDACESVQQDKLKVCDSATTPDPAGCRSSAAEVRWMCRKACGVDEPKPVAAATATPAPKPSATAAATTPFARNLSKVCEGTAEPSAKAYDGAKGQHHAAIVAFKNGPEARWVAETIGEDYRALGVPDTNAKADVYELVVCVSVKDSKMVKTCDFPKPPPAHVLELHDATYEVRVVEAKTAKVVKSETVPVKQNLKRCPVAWTFSAQRQVSLPLHKDTVYKVAKKLVDP